MVVIIITTTTTTHRENEKSNYFSNNASSTRVFNKSFLLLLLLLLSFHRISMIFTKKIVINFILKEQNPLRTTILLEKFSKRGGGGRGGLSKSKSVDPIIRLYLKTLSPPPLFSQRSNRRPSNRRGCSNLHCHNEGSRLQRFPLTPPSHLRVLSRAPLQKAQTSSR